jgi:hypothetical protein
MVMRYKVWRSNKDKSLHLLCREGAEAFEALPSVVRNRDRGPVVATARSTAYGFPIA